MEIYDLRVRSGPLKTVGETTGFAKPVGPSELQGDHTS